MTMIARIINFFKKREENKGEREERTQEIAERTVPKISDPLYHFICSSNRSLTVAFHNLFTVGAPVYGGSAEWYNAERGRLSERRNQAEALSIPFGGTRAFGPKVEAVSSVSDVLSNLSLAAHGSVYISVVQVGSRGQAWVQEVYTTLLDEAVAQGILPFPMFTTPDKRAALFLIDSFELLSPS